MKRRDLIRHLAVHGCVFVREGRRHSVYLNPATRRISTIPRHAEINTFTARKVCEDLGIPPLKK